jgi:thioredoxin-dependent peroxiredoxin
MTKLTVGATAPRFTLPSDDGTTVSSSQLRGERFVLYFYPADDTPGCTKEACQFNELFAAFNTANVTVYGVSPDTAESHRAFRKKYSLKFPLLSDEKKTTMAKFGAYGEKMLYGKKVIGVIRSTFVIGPSGKVEHAWYGVRTEGHAARVLAGLST